MRRIARRPKEHPSPYKMTYRAARMGYTLVETSNGAPTFTPVFTIYRGWPHGTEHVKTFSTPAQVYNWLNKHDQ